MIEKILWNQNGLNKTITRINPPESAAKNRLEMIPAEDTATVPKRNGRRFLKLTDEKVSNLAEPILAIYNMSKSARQELSKERKS